MSDQEREALIALVNWIDLDLDLSDNFSVEQAVRKELISCTRTKECWERGDVVVKAARALIAAREDTERPDDVR
jgi:hypothetical protein